MQARLVWYREQRTLPNGRERMVRVAWIVADDPEQPEAAPRHLAYLGADPTITDRLREEFAALYPEVDADWDELAESAEIAPTDVSKLTLDDLAFRLRMILGEYGYLLDQIDFRLGKGWRRPLRQIELFARDPGAVGRFERTAGSFYAYLCQKHPETAYALLKIRTLLIEGEAALEAMEASEPEFKPGSRFARYRAHCRKVLSETPPPEPDVDI